MRDVDVMAFGAHPDDVEQWCGGTLIKLADRGFTTVIVDLVEGELSTRGTVETRRKEAAAAAKVLGTVSRDNLALEDGHIRSNKAAKRRVVEVIRKYRPRLLLIPYSQDRHPDHCHASELTYEGAFLAGLARYDTGQEQYRPAQVAYYMGWYDFEPTFVVDITEQFDRKMEAVYAYSTQFRPDDPAYEQTRLTSPQHHRMLIHRMGHYGSLIGKDYGEGFLVRGKLEFTHPLEARFSTF